MSSRIILLTAEDVVLLCLRIKNNDQDEGVLLAKPLLLKLFSAFNEITNEEGDPLKTGVIAVAVTEPEAWIMRGCISPFDKGQKDPSQGFHLLRKIFRVLLELNSDFDAEEYVKMFNEKESTEVFTRLTKRLDEIVRQKGGAYNARTNNNPDKDGASNRARP